jgi:hypothetical protein
MKNKIIFGGDNLDNNLYKQMEVFLSIIIIGYFGIKIIYGLFFNFYPDKYYYRNININTNEYIDSEESNTSNTENITLNAYVPGIWNNEITDFISLMVLCGVVFIYTHVSTKSFVDIYGNLNLSFLFGYIIGLGYPVFYINYIKYYVNIVNSTNVIKYIYLIILVIFIIFIIVLNYYEANKISDTHKYSYLIYCVAIILLLFGLLITKKNIKSYNTVTYFHNNGEQCSFSKDGIFESSGDVINITVPFITFILLLFFSYEPNEITMKNLYTFIYGILLGILVSSISYFGIEYFLIKKPERQCTDINECIYKEMTVTEEEAYNYVNSNINSNINAIIDYTNKQSGNISLLKLTLIITIIIASIYLFYTFYINKKIST